MKYNKIIFCFCCLMCLFACTTYDYEMPDMSEAGTPPDESINSPAYAYVFYLSMDMDLKYAIVDAAQEKYGGNATIKMKVVTKDRNGKFIKEDTVNTSYAYSGYTTGFYVDLIYEASIDEKPVLKVIYSFTREQLLQQEGQVGFDTPCEVIWL